MKSFKLLFFLLLSIESYAQLKSYSDSYSQINMLFDATFNVSQNSEAPKKFILSAKKKYEIGLHVGPFDKNYSKTLNQAFDEADCNNCHLTQKKLTNSPIEFVFDTIKYGDVFIVTKFKKQFKVELYQKK